MGHTNYPLDYKIEIVRRINKGEITLRGFCRDNNINRSVVKRWKREAKNGMPPKRKKVRPRTNLTTNEALLLKIEELQMQVDFYQFFLKAAGSKPDQT